MEARGACSIFASSQNHLPAQCRGLVDAHACGRNGLSGVGATFVQRLLAAVLSKFAVAAVSRRCGFVGHGLVVVVAFCTFGPSPDWLAVVHECLVHGVAVCQKMVAATAAFSTILHQAFARLLAPTLRRLGLGVVCLQLDLQAQRGGPHASIPHGP